jgi:hypothetical protein
MHRTTGCGQRRAGWCGQVGRGPHQQALSANRLRWPALCGPEWYLARTHIFRASSSVGTPCMKSHAACTSHLTSTIGAVADVCSPTSSAVCRSHQSRASSSRGATTTLGNWAARAGSLRPSASRPPRPCAPFKSLLAVPQAHHATTTRELCANANSDHPQRRTRRC